MEVGERDVAESGTARPSHFVHRHLLGAAQRGHCAVRNTQTHTRTCTHTRVLSLLTQQVWSCLFLSWAPPTFLLCCSAHPVTPSVSPLSSRLHLPSSHLSPPLSWLNYSWQLIVPNGQRAADTEGFISAGPWVCRCHVFLRGLDMCARVGGTHNGVARGSLGQLRSLVKKNVDGRRKNMVPTASWVMGWWPVQNLISCCEEANWSRRLAAQCDVVFFAAIPDESLWKKHSEMLVLCHTVRQVQGRLLSGWPKTAGDKILTVSKIWDDHLAVWLLLRPTSTDQPVEMLHETTKPVTGVKPKQTGHDGDHFAVLLLLLDFSPNINCLKGGGSVLARLLLLFFLFLTT